MKMYEDVDDIFFQGLEGKSIDKPSEFWDEMSAKVLRKSMARPWWASLNTYVVGSIVLIAAVLVIMMTTSPGNEPKENIQKAVPENIEDVKDTSGIRNDSSYINREDKEQAVPPSIPESKARDAEEDLQNEKDVPSQEVTEEMSSNMADEDAADSGLIREYEVPRLEDNRSRVKDEGISDVLIDTLKIRRKGKDEILLEEKKVKKPIVVIVQDTIVVTDTIKTKRRK